MLSMLDDDSLVSGGCDDILSSSITACSSLSTSSSSILCNVADACLSDDDDGEGEDDDDGDDGPAPCPTDSCDVPHSSWLGDGWCDYDYGSTRCYNTAACGYDGGDCCEGSCVSSTYLTCGLHGYQCIDPDAQPCTGEMSTMHMYDSFGDGWNGATYLIAEALTSTTVASGTLDTGSEASDEMCLNTGCYIISVTAGSWSNEISWQFDVDDSAVGEGGAPATCYFSVSGNFCDNIDAIDNADISACSTSPTVDDDDDDCSAVDYTLVLHDANGAGWSETSYTLSTHASSSSAGTTVKTGTLAAGFQSTESICLPDGCYTMAIDGGGLQYSWELGSSDSGVVAEGVAPVNCDFSVGATPSCETTCTSALSDTCLAGQSAYLLAMHDKGGDGWNGNSYTISTLSGNEVATGTLDSGAYNEDSVCLDDGKCFRVSVSGGTKSSEVYWQLGSPSAGEIASGEGADASTCDFSTPGSSDTSQACLRTCFDINDDDDGGGCSPSGEKKCS